MSGISGKVAVVTGAGSGIGRALALGLAQRGSRLALSDVNCDGLTDTVDLVKSLGAEVRADRLDVSERDAVDAYASAVVDHYGIVNQLYNNAGIAAGSTTVLGTDYATYERVFGVNLWGVISGTKAFLPHLIASGDGHVVNISSLNGIMGQPHLSAYCASKFAVRGFTESLRAEMITARHPVKVTVVHPGGVKTNIATAALSSTESASASDAVRTRVYNDKLLTMAPAKAAQTILTGVEAGKGRVLVGNDAKAIDLVVRLAPRWYPALTAWWERRTFDGG